MYSETLTQQKLKVMNSSTISRIEEILSDEAIAFIYHLETKFGNKRVELLKDREKRIEQDEIWKKICKYLNWEFIPTI